MRLFRVAKPEEALSALIQAYIDSHPVPETETVSVEDAFGRFLAEDITSRENIPPFVRSTMDGYAVLAADTAGAGESMPVLLDVAERIRAGSVPSERIGSGRCSYVPTGGMLPDGADAVVPVEYCQTVSETRIAVYAAVSPGRNTVLPGEDVPEGASLLRKGTRIFSAETGLLCAAGVTTLRVFSPLKVRIISTGDEIVPPEEIPGPGKMRDVNGAALAAKCREMGLIPTGQELVPDNPDLLIAALKRASGVADVVLCSGGSSKGEKDLTADAIEQVAGRPLLVHGISMKPGKPAIIGLSEGNGCALIGLPGHPVAALLVCGYLLGGLWNRVTGADQRTNAVRFTFGITGRNIPSSPGRKTMQQVRLIENGEGLPTVMPVNAKSGLIRSLTETDGFVVIDENSEGIRKGETVRVWLNGIFT